MKKNNGSVMLWFWTLIPALFVAAICLLPALEKRFDIGDYLLDIIVGLVMVFISPFAWAMQLKAEASQMRPKAVLFCRVIYGGQIVGIILFYLSLATWGNY